MCRHARVCVCVLLLMWESMYVFIQSTPSQGVYVCVTADVGVHVRVSVKFSLSPQECVTTDVGVHVRVYTKRGEVREEWIKRLR